MVGGSGGGSRRAREMGEPGRGVELWAKNGCHETFALQGRGLGRGYLVNPRRRRRPVASAECCSYMFHRVNMLFLLILSPCDSDSILTKSCPTARERALAAPIGTVQD